VSGQGGTAGLQISDLAKNYGSVASLDGLDLDVPPGALIGFLGPNGSGKTTTMRSILGMARPDR
jgi:ABC-2 type transport system ATP-binding protein